MSEDTGECADDGKHAWAVLGPGRRDPPHARAGREGREPCGRGVRPGRCCTESRGSEVRSEAADPDRESRCGCGKQQAETPPHPGPFRVPSEEQRVGTEPVNDVQATRAAGSLFLA